MRGGPLKPQTGWGFRKDIEQALQHAESMLSGVDFSRSDGNLPAHEGETDQFVKDRIFYHLTTKVLAPLRRAVTKLKRQLPETHDVHPKRKPKHGYRLRSN